MKKVIYITIVIILVIGLRMTLISSSTQLSANTINKDSVDYVTGLDSNLISNSFIPYDDDTN
jgi:hypothetical protein